MSEYQYYEFRAIDRALDRSALTALRALSTRARITPTSFTNEYSYGDFRGDPDELMENYFDAHLYVANWGTRQLMLRVPVQLLPLSAVEPYTAEEGLRAWATGTHVILDFVSRSEDDYGWTEGAGQLDPLLPVRAELLAGDLRALYLGWLAAVESGEIDGGATEPPVPPGLGTLSPALTDFAEFLRVDPDLIEIAARASASRVSTRPSVADLASWVAELPEGEKNTALVQLLTGEGASAAVDLLSRFRADAARAKSRGGAPAPGARRTVGELLAARERGAEENRRRAAEKKAHEESRLARERAEARARRLDTLVGKEASLWREAGTAVGTKLPKQYDHAVQLLTDLRDLAQRADAMPEFARRIGELREQHRKKPSFIERLDKAGMPK
ncbi:hypothetical protein VT84_24600 [Gemmata sp. SH-PL17]|uniref:hypothetical protein n=1 Tax=Gemmata sp. SH-PL17 TaxID=1630693 RepID=UPI00078D0030|nr:hypothetical protein [Gemmata sp. SH-PL17]AMV27605.1 hypothetical protein VT84_24600 [Gemmata sp. SH-PL17]